MNLNEDQVRRFQGIYKSYYGKPIAYDLANQYAIELVQLIRCIYLPIKIHPENGGDVYGSTE